MAIKLRATNIKTYVKNTYTTISGPYTETAEKVSMVATNGNFEMSSAKKAISQGLDDGVKLDRKVEYKPIVVPQAHTEEKKQWKIKTPLVIDRYKMPGLNRLGTDIADDMCFGYGTDAKQMIYPPFMVENYKKEYEARTINNYLDGVMTNEKNFDTYFTLPNTKLDPFEAINRATCIRNAKAKYNKDEITAVSLRADWGNYTQSDAELFYNFKAYAKFFFAKGELKINIEKMIDKFQRNEGGIYENRILTNAVIANPQTDIYCGKIETYLKSKINACNYDLATIEDKHIYFESDQELLERRYKKDFSRPVYNENKTEGLTIALNDIWSTEVVLTRFTPKDDKNYTAKYQVTLWDHFGLDILDIGSHFFNYLPVIGRAFDYWFVLQHLRGYKPFITKITFEKEFKGSVQ